MDKTKNEVVNEIRNGVDHNTLINYLMNYDFTEEEMREFWKQTTEFNWLQYQGKNMSKDFKREISAKDEYTEILADELEVKEQVLSYDWSNASKNKWNKFRKFVKDSCGVFNSGLRGCNDYYELVKHFVDEFAYQRYSERDGLDFEERMKHRHQDNADGYKTLREWLNNN